VKFSASRWSFPATDGPDHQRTETRGWKANHSGWPHYARRQFALLRRKKFVTTTDSRHGLPVYPNLAATWN